MTYEELVKYESQILKLQKFRVQMEARHPHLSKDDMLDALNAALDLFQEAKEKALI